MVNYKEFVKNVLHSLGIKGDSAVRSKESCIYMRTTVLCRISVSTADQKTCWSEIRAEIRSRNDGYMYIYSKSDTRSLRQPKVLL